MKVRSYNLFLVSKLLTVVSVNEADIFPFHENAVVDVNGLDVDPGELFYHGVQNATHGGEGVCEATESVTTPRTNQIGLGSTLKDQTRPEFLYQHGSQYVNEYPRRDERGLKFRGEEDNPNHLLGAFPYLFPYGMGGFEITRKHNVSYAQHANWALRYHDGRFAKNTTFMSQAFNVLQKREVCHASELQVCELCSQCIHLLTSV